jgi:hypothetical protein
MSGMAVGKTVQVVRDPNCEDFNNMKKELSLTYLCSDGHLGKRDEWTL